MTVIIPVWFYGFDSAMYFISAIIGFLLSFYFHRMFSISAEKRHMYLHVGFLLLSIGLLTLSITDMFSYLAYSDCLSTHGPCTLSLVDNVFSIDDFSYLIYFGLSIFAYALFMLAFSEEYIKVSRILVLAFLGYLALVLILTPLREGGGLWYAYSEYFHLTAFVMLVLVAFKNFINYTEIKSANSLLVAVSFSFIALFHFFHMFLFLSGWMYVFGHIALLTGFIALLAMVYRVKRK